MVDEGLREKLLLFESVLRKRSLCVKSIKCSVLPIKLDHDPGDLPCGLLQRRRHKFLYGRSPDLFRELDRVTSHERVGDRFLVWKELIKRCRGNVSFSSNGVRGCRVVTKFSEDPARRIEQTCHAAFSPSVSPSIWGKNRHASIFS